MRVCLFEDRRVEDLEPLTLTRPAHDLLCGLGSLAGKQWRYFAPCSAGVLVRPDLANLQRQRSGIAVNDLAWLRSGPAILVNSRWLPPPGSTADLSRPCVATVADEVAYAVVAQEHLALCSPETMDECTESWKSTLLRREAGGTMVRHLWELVDRNGEQIILDHEQTAGRRGIGTGPGVAVVGPRERLVIDPTATLDPMVVVDTTNGPVVIDAEAVVTAFTRLEGPCYVGPHCHVLGAKVRAGTSLGPSCRIGGEIEASIIQGHSNKYHDGFLGHAYIGEWVNLGAGTSNSDLRNDYGEVTVTVAGRRVATEQSKVGCFLGDHTKTGLGTLLNTGTSAGVFCNLLPSGGLLPKYVPSFCSVWNGALTENTDLPALLETARKVMERRGVDLTSEHQELYRALLSRTARERQRALREAEQRRLRRSA
jgi:UDP-N-acetylglucosamine diphosphorylase / glucose-1-phosphate thymidylyltransferase / UDP-N-acetylgalactosamine diphosphorylase / glucosamine-1-phosphate N-acetyltransferase / galactosamine-1-phosphate N-acetyltransferase